MSSRHRSYRAGTGAVQDTFVIAASRLAGLRDQNRLRPWLYAVARNECHRRLRARAAQVATPLDAMPDVTDTSADVIGEAEREDLRVLVRSAIRGLNAGEADLVELQLRQGLDAAEIADVLGVSRNHAHRAHTVGSASGPGAPTPAAGGLPSPGGGSATSSPAATHSSTSPRPSSPAPARCALCCSSAARTS